MVRVLIPALLVALVVSAFVYLDADPAMLPDDVAFEEGEARITAASLAGRGDSLATAALGPKTGTARLHGTVRRSGLAAENAYVGLGRIRDRPWNVDGGTQRAWSPYGLHVHAPRPSRDMRAGADGSYGFEGLAAGQYVLVVGPANAQRVLRVDVPTDAATVEFDIELPSGSASFRGRAVLPDGRPFRGRLSLHPARRNAWYGHVSDAADIVVTTTAADGRVDVSGLTPDLYTVIPLMAMPSPGVGPFAVPHDEPYVIEVGVERTHFRVEIRDAATGAPITGAAVRVGPDVGPQVATASGEDGIASLHLDGHPARVVVEADGYVAAVAESLAQVSEIPDRLCVRLWPEGRIEGRVADAAGTPRAGVDVYRYDERCSGPPPPEGGHPEPLHLKSHTVTDERGAYAFEGVTPGRHTVFALGAGVVSPGVYEAELDGYNPLAVILAPGETRRADLAVVDAVVLRGRVVDNDGRPVPRATVLCFTTHGRIFFNQTVSHHWFDHRQPTTADEDGRFTLSCLVPETDFRLGVVAPGHVPLETGDLEMETDGNVVGDGSVRQPGTKDVLLRMPTSSRIEIRVTDATSGEPIPGALVDLSSPFDFWVSGSNSGLDEIRARALVGLTDEDGRLALGPVTSGGHSGTVQAPGFVEAQVELPDGSGVTEVGLRRASRLTGRLLLPDDAVGPVAGQTLTYAMSASAPPDWAARGGQPRAVTEHLEDEEGADAAQSPHLTHLDAEGTVHVSHIPADVVHTVFVMATVGERSFVGHMPLGAADDGFEVEMEEVIPADDQVVAMRVQTLVLEGDAALDLSRAIATPIPLNADGRPYGYGVLPKRAIDRRVEFETAQGGGIDAVLWYVLPSGDRPVGGRLAAPVVHGPIPVDQAETRLTLESAREVPGRLLADDGSPVRGARIAAVATLSPSSPAFQHSATRHAVAVTDHAGRFRLRGLGDFDYVLSFDLPPGFADVLRRPLRRSARTFELTVNRAVTAEVLVRAPDGGPVENADITVGWIQSGNYEVIATARANERGRASLDGLDPGEAYEIYVSGYVRRSPSGYVSLSRRSWTSGETLLETERTPTVKFDIQHADGERVKTSGQYRIPGRGWSWFSIGEEPARIAVPPHAELEVRFDGKAYPSTQAERTEQGFLVVVPRR